MCYDPGIVSRPRERAAGDRSSPDDSTQGVPMKFLVSVVLLSLAVAIAAGAAVAAPRLVIGELFTNTFCPPCATFDPVLDEWGSGHPDDFVLLAIHGWWPGYGDVFWQADSLENRPRINYYGADYAPHLRFDGTTDLGSTANPTSWTNALNARKAVTPPLDIALTATYNAGTRDGVLSATITNTSASTVSGNFRAVLVESIWYHTAGGNGYDGNNGTIRDYAPSVTGTPVSLGPGASTVVNTAYVVPAVTPPAPGVVEARSQLVAFVQGASREIYQGARLYFPFDGPSLLLDGVTQTVASGGDGDAYVDRGETGEAVLTLRNRNPSAGAGLTGTVTTTDPYTTILDGTASFSTIPGYGTGSNAGDPFTFTVSPSAPSGYSPTLTLTLSGYPTPINFVVDVGSPADYSGPGGSYYAYETGDAGYTETPTYAWVEIDSTLGGPGRRVTHYPDSYDWVRIGFNFRYFGVVYDTVSVMSNGFIALGKQTTGTGGDKIPYTLPSTSGPGAMIAGMWTDLDPTASVGKIWRYTDTVNHRFIVEWSRVRHQGAATTETFQIILLDPAFYPTSNGDGEIIVQYKDVTDPASCGAGIENGAETLGLMYTLLGHDNPSAQGLADLRAIKYTPDAPVRTDVAAGSGSGPALLLAASPNPFHGSTSIAFRLPARQQASLDVYGVDGRRVATLWNGVAEAGVTTAHWNGLDGDGRPVAAGLYFAKFRTEGGTQVGKVMVLR